MFKYFKAMINIIINYKIYFVPVIVFEFFFFISHNKKYNRFKYLDSNFLSDSIPCPYFFLKKIEKYMLKKKINLICDLGSGYGKILYYLGKISKKKIHGVEIEKEIYHISQELTDDNIKLFNEDILKFRLDSVLYDAFILNDPLKNADDLLKLLLRIKSSYENVELILINLDLKKQIIIQKELNIIEKFEASNNKNIFFCNLK
tara:strand:+ start:673 stop:1281 length:609 start_codon:yes stop_codon:yes gene_type:complete